MARDNTTCRPGKVIKEYDSKNEAQRAATYAQRSFGTNLKPYNCNKCGNWHLLPLDRMTPSAECSFCNKQLYRTQEEAQNRARIILKEKGVSLNIYKCKWSDGWHLTSNSNLK